jgi:hypothetical protein
MRDQGREFLTYVQILILLVIIGTGALVLLGSRVGGLVGELYGSLRDVFAGDDRITVDAQAPAALVAGPAPPVRLPSVEDTVVVPLPAFPAAAVPQEEVPCAAFHFEASLGIEGGYLSFGRFNVVTDTDPYGRRDSLTIWKLLQFNGFRINADTFEAHRAVTIPVNETVNMLVSDPFTKELLFSARWLVSTVEVRGHHGSINAALEANLSSFGVNNAIDSSTLDSFAEDSEGVLVMRFVSDRDIAPALKAGEPVYGEVTGTMYPAHCIHQ